MLFVYKLFPVQTRTETRLLFISTYLLWFFFFFFFMEMPSLLLLLFFFFVISFFHCTYSSTIVVDGVSQWSNPTVHVGDTIIFRHKNHYNLYIFQSEDAFTLCNFTQASLLTQSSSSYTWHPSRTGSFYFGFNNGSSSTCLATQKFAVQVSLPSASPPSHELPAVGAPAPIAGGIVSSSPSFPWPFRPREELSPGPAPDANSPSSGPSLKGGIPFINSNPAVPLPTGEVDSATIQPLPTSTSKADQVVVGLLQLQMALFSAMLVVL